MKFTYDPRYNIAYLRFKEKQGGVESVRISDELVIDMASDGTLYGIELLNANVQLGKADQGEVIVVNEATGKEVKFPLAVS